MVNMRSQCIMSTNKPMTQGLIGSIYNQDLITRLDHPHFKSIRFSIPMSRANLYCFFACASVATWMLIFACKVLLLNHIFFFDLDQKYHQ